MAVRAGAVALAVALAGGAVLTTLVNARRMPDAGREATYWLAVESLAVDGDLRLEEIDRARFTARFGRRPPQVQVVPEGDARVLAAPWLWTRLAAAARGLLGHAGPPLLQWALVAWTALAALLTLAPRLGAGSAGWLILVTLFASAAFAAPLRLEPRALEMAAMATAAAAVWRRRLGPAKAADDVYRGDLDTRPSALRWLVAGAACGPVAAASPAYLPLLVPFVAAAPPERRGSAGALFAVGAIASAGALVILGGAPWEAIATSLSAPLFGWGALGLLVGRGVGVLPYFLPAILLVTLAGRGEGRRWVVPAVAAASALLLALAPFDFLEGALPRGNAWFLAPLALLLLAAESSESPRSVLAVGALGLPLLAAPWLAACGARDTARAVERRVVLAERLLPVASTLRWQPSVDEVARGGVVARGVAPGIVGGDGALRIDGQRADLLVTSDRPLASVRFELGHDAPAGIDVRGGALGDVIYRPNGEVALDIALDPRRARHHPVWWSPAAAWTYPLELRLSAPPTRPLPLELAFGRPVIPGGDGPP